MKVQPDKYLKNVLHAGVSADMNLVQKTKLITLNTFLVIIIAIIVPFTVLFLALGSYTAIQGFLFIPFVVLVLYLNFRKLYKLARILLIYSLLILTLLIALSDRRTGTEYGLMALGCSSVLIFDHVASIFTAFFVAIVFYVFYTWYDATHPFVPNPTIPYFVVQNAIMALSAFVVVAQSFVFRQLINTFSRKLKDAHDEIESVNEELKASNEELLVFSERLDVMVKQKSAELQAYLDAININLYSAVTDWEGNIISVNKPLTELTGYQSDELIGKNFRLINSNYHPDQFFKNLLETIYSGKSWRGEVKNMAKDGSYFWLDMVVIPVKEQKEKPAYFLVVALPITERKVLEDERIKSISMLELIAFHTSHEIRGPLARILGLTNLIEKDLIDADEVLYVANKLVESSKELDAATRNLTNFINEHQGGLLYHSKV
jgi:PAS domain S-box-containing protein